MSSSFLLLAIVDGLTILALGVFIVLAFDSLIFRHDLSTSRRAIRTICKIISDYKKENGNFYDLGCGRGKLVLIVKKEFPSLSVWAVDKNPLRIFFARLKSLFLRRKINFKRKNVFQLNFADLQNADVVYTYLWYDVMPKLEEKLKDSLKRGAIIITNTSNFLNWPAKETHITYPKNPDFEKLFVYINN